MVSRAELKEELYSSFKEDEKENPKDFKEPEHIRQEEFENEPDEKKEYAKQVYQNAEIIIDGNASEDFAKDCKNFLQVMNSK